MISGSLSPSQTALNKVLTRQCPDLPRVEMPSKRRTTQRAGSPSPFLSAFSTTACSPIRALTCRGWARTWLGFILYLVVFRVTRRATLTSAGRPFAAGYGRMRQIFTSTGPPRCGGHEVCVLAGPAAGTQHGDALGHLARRQPRAVRHCRRGRVHPQLLGRRPLLRALQTAVPGPASVARQRRASAGRLVRDLEYAATCPSSRLGLYGCCRVVSLPLSAVMNEVRGDF